MFNLAWIEGRGFHVELTNLPDEALDLFIEWAKERGKQQMAQPPPPSRQ